MLGRDGLRTIRDLNQRNLALTVELDQERIIIDDLKNELTDARSIKQEILERGKASNLKANLLNEELPQKSAFNLWRKHWLRRGKRGFYRVGEPILL